MAQAPNRIDVVRRLANDYPDEFRNAHRNYPAPAGPARDSAEQFIRRLAWVLHQEDARFHLNVKQNQANGRISQDAVAWVPPTGQKEIYDVIVAAGSPDATPAWNLVDEGPRELVDVPQPVSGGGGGGGGGNAEPMPNRFGVVRNLAGRFRMMLQEDPDGFTQIVAERLAKDNVAWGRFMPTGANGISRDKLAWAPGGNFQGQVVDIIQSAGGPNARESWSQMTASGAFVAVADVDPDPDPDPDPDESDLAKRVAQLETWARGIGFKG